MSYIHVKSQNNVYFDGKYQNNVYFDINPEKKFHKGSPYSQLLVESYPEKIVSSLSV